MRAVQDGAIELRRLDQVLAAMGRQRAADEGDRRGAVEQAQFAQRVGEVDILCPVRRCAGGDQG